MQDKLTHRLANALVARNKPRIAKETYASIIIGRICRTVISDIGDDIDGV